MYDGEIREMQIQALLDLASEISFGSDDPAQPARARVDWYCENYELATGGELPHWFDAHDRELLVRFVEEIER